MLLSMVAQCILPRTSEYNLHHIIIHAASKTPCFIFNYSYQANFLSFKRYAEFWGYNIDSELVRYLTVLGGSCYMMLGTFWIALLRDVGTWKAYGLACIVYWGVTVDCAFISKTGWLTSPEGIWADLTLSYIAIITSEPWNL